jgi:hypothetical protein
MIATEPLAPAQTFTVPKPPQGDAAAARQVAQALQGCAAEITSAQRLAHTILEAAYQDWTGSSATAMRHPLTELDRQTVQVARALTQAADQLDHYAHQLDKAHQQHHWSLGNILKVAAVVVVTAAAVVVTVGAAAPAAAAIDGALVGAEIAATTVAVGAATTAAVEAAEAVTLAVRALQALRAVATFLKPAITVTAGLTDYEAIRQVQATGTLDVGTLSQHAATNLAFLATGTRAAALLGTGTASVLSTEALNPVARWLLPKAVGSTGWGLTTAADDLLTTGHLDVRHVGDASGFAFGAAFLPGAGGIVGAASRVPTTTIEGDGWVIVDRGANWRAGNTRTINFRPDAQDPRWGLREYHARKHLFGLKAPSLRVVDPGGRPDQWVGYLQDLAGRPATRIRDKGVEQIMGRFPRADGRGTFKLGIRVSPRGDGSFDLVTILTEQ